VSNCSTAASPHSATSFEGCRYSKLTTMHFADFNADAGVVTVGQSKAGKDTGCSRRLGRASSENELIFACRDGGGWGKPHQLRSTYRMPMWRARRMASSRRSLLSLAA
jgi:hypothetical protein